MICPRCKKDMRVVNMQGLELDVCDSCEGIWFDHGELTRIMQEHKGDLSASDIAASWEGEIKEGEEPGQDELTCPRCSEKLRRYNYSYSSSVVIDGCGHNKCGVWLDDGELKRIAEYLSEYKKNLSPEQKEELKQKLAQVKQDYESREDAFVDSLVKMDDQPGLMKYPGEVLQFIYSIMYKMGL